MGCGGVVGVSFGGVRFGRPFGVSLWCVLLGVLLVYPFGVSFCCDPLVCPFVCPLGVSSWGVLLGCPFGVSCWCVLLVCPFGVSLMSFWGVLLGCQLIFDHLCAEFGRGTARRGARPLSF